MEYMPEPTTTGTHMILCCQCGTQIEPNPANMCVACLRSEVDITEGIPKTSVIYFCKACERYLQPPQNWVICALESRELLTVCLKKIKGLNKVRLVDAGFIWTEPHSKRIKVKLSIQKEVMNGAMLQQVFVVEFTVSGQMCDDCHRVEAKDFWRAVVQVRQKTQHKKTLFYLEQLILKHNAHTNTSNIKALPEGIDFYYAEKRDAKRLVEFLQTVVPIRYCTAQELVSHDIHNNSFNYKQTYSAEIVPICKDNIVCLPPKLAQSLGNMGQICLCNRVTQTVYLIDPQTLQLAEVSGTTYWRTPFNSLCHPKQLLEFVVMQIELIGEKDRRHVAGASQMSQKHVLAECWVVRASELGTSEQQYFCRTHLGHLLQPGDYVLGYDLRTANINDTYLEKIPAHKLPDVVLVKKMFAGSLRSHKKRKWKLQHLTKIDETDPEKDEKDYQDFLEDLEEDPVYRQNVNIYKDAKKLAVDADDTDDEEIPQISLQEMLDDLHIDGADATGGEGAEMQD
jgi:nonsense-mediated mRNA decay protein 3